jgi:hypothetical protein
MPTQSFNCPACGAGLDVIEEGATTMECTYCHTSVAIPLELRKPITPKPIQLTKTQIRWIWIFIIVVFVVPTCLGLIGTLVGVVVSVLAPLLAIFLGAH